MTQSKNVHVYINYQEQDVAAFDRQSIIKPAMLYERNAVVPLAELKDFVAQDYKKKIQQEVEQQVAVLREQMDAQLHQEITQEKLRLATQALKQVKGMRHNIEKILGQEFSIGDPLVIQSIVEKSVKLLTEDALSKVFVSQDNYEMIKKKIGEPTITILGVTAPIGIGANLSQTQVMVEGGKTVLVSDLEHMLSQYLNDGLSDQEAI